VVGVDGTGLTLAHEDGQPRWVAVSDAAMELLEQIQHDFGEGPCLAAFAEDWTGPGTTSMSGSGPPTSATTLPTSASGSPTNATTSPTNATAMPTRATEPPAIPNSAVGGTGRQQGTSCRARMAGCDVGRHPERGAVRLSPGEQTVGAASTKE
jgi:hypothetical protein